MHKEDKILNGISLSKSDIQSSDVIEYFDENSVKFVTSGKLIKDKEAFISCFEGGVGTYQFNFNFEYKLKVNTLDFVICLSGWEDIRYLALGYTNNGMFRHIKVPNPIQDSFFREVFSFSDLSFLLANQWQEVSEDKIHDLRIYISGKPKRHGARIEVKKVSAWLKSDNDEIGANLTYSSDLYECLVGYFKRCNPDYLAHADGYMNNGMFPTKGKHALEWCTKNAKPQNFEDSGTYKYLWHSLSIAHSLLLAFYDTKEFKYLFASKTLVEQWLENSFYTPDQDIKYAWYDHGVAERVLTLILLRLTTFDLELGYRFEKRLDFALTQQANLLATESFYAKNQPTRFHNHAWFQDMALLACSIALGKDRNAKYWGDKGEKRLRQQLDCLIVRDEGYSVFIENSFGYHLGIEKLVDFAAQLTNILSIDSEIPSISKELKDWSNFYKYPSGGSASNGDTFRLSPNPNKQKVKYRAYSRPELIVLKKAGYGIVKGNHDGIPFMLNVLGTSLTETHKHNDHLSFTLFFDGIEWLLDPSFYSHDYGESAASFLKTEQAHNCLVIESESYSISPGLCCLSGERDEHKYKVFGRHKAYEEIIVERTIEGAFESLNIQFKDSIVTNKKVNSCLNFMVAEDVTVDVLDGCIVLSHAYSDYTLMLRVGSRDVKLISGISTSSNEHGIVGVGFKEHEDTTRISVDLKNEMDSINWSIEAINKVGV